MASPADIRQGVIEAGDPGPLGYRRLTTRPQEPHVPRGGPGQRLHGILCFVHLTDLHVMDAQSPARLDFLDRLGDSDSPHAAGLGRVGTYRPQEPFSYHVVEAMTRAVRSISGGPVTGREPDFAVSTGDSTDNAQANELRGYLDLLDGAATVRPDSGRATRFEGCADPGRYDPRYWHPDGPPPGHPADYPTARHGLPHVPGLHDACRLPFQAAGLGLPWYAGYGNHDRLLGGILPYSPGLAELVTGPGKPGPYPVGPEMIRAFAGSQFRPMGHQLLLDAPMLSVTADPERRRVTTSEWIAEHLTAAGLPAGHGFTAQAARDGRAWYAFDAASVRCLMLDTVNPNGGWQGSLDREQFTWLTEQLADARRQGSRGCLLFSHHPLDALINPWAPDGAERVGRDEAGRLVVACTSLDHHGLIDPRLGALDDPLTLAGWSRELAANQWQPVRNAAGTPEDRNVILG